MGSTFHISTAVMPFAELPSEHTKNVIGLDAGGQNLFEPGAMSTPSLLVVGSESHGLSSDIREACHAIASIPGSRTRGIPQRIRRGGHRHLSLPPKGLDVGQRRCKDFTPLA